MYSKVGTYVSCEVIFGIVRSGLLVEFNGRYTLMNILSRHTMYAKAVHVEDSSAPHRCAEGHISTVESRVQINHTICYKQPNKPSAVNIADVTSTV